MRPRFRLSSLACLLPCLLMSSAAVLLAGCASQQASLNPGNTLKIKRMAVVSVAARTFVQQSSGINGGGQEELDIVNWKLDDHYEKLFGAELQNRFHFSVARSPYSPTSFLPVNDILESWDQPGEPSPEWSSIQIAGRAHCRRNNLDALLIIGRSTSMDFLANTSHGLRGAGIYTRDTPASHISAMHLIAKVILFDCATAKVLAVRSVGNIAEDSSTGRPDVAPVLAIDPEEARIPIAEWSSARRQKVRTELGNLPAKTVADTLKSLFTPVARDKNLF